MVDRNTPVTTMNRLFLAKTVLFLLSNQITQAASPGIQSFHLHPTSELLVKDSRRSLLQFPESWFHPNSNGVYATLPKGLDPQDLRRRQQLDDFHAHRHLSRYERRYRLNADIDLEANWDGVYRDSNFTDHRHLKAHEDPYVTTPLNQGYGTHYVNLWVGTPIPQRKTVIVDTGSHYTAFPCTGCHGCGESFHTDPYFNPSQSDTFRPLKCGECIRDAVCRDYKCVLSQFYTEGSSWDAYLARDRLFCGGNNILDAADPKNQDFSIPFMFGCQTAETGLFVTQLADGIMGMSAHESTLPKRLYDLNKIDHNMFTMCFQQQLSTSRHGVTAGVMTLGGVDERINASPIVYAKNMAVMGWYTLYVKKMYLQTESSENKKRTIQIPIDILAANSGKGVILDSGTTDTYLHKKLAQSFGSVWKKVTGKDYHHKPISLTQDQIKQLPTVLVQCQAAYIPKGSSLQQGKNDLLAEGLDSSSPNDVLVSIPPTSYMEYSPMTKTYSSRIYFTESQGGVLGANSMLGYNVLFDWEHGRIGFAKSTCEYPDDKSSLDEMEVPASNSCILGEPTLSNTCLESLDLDQCGQNPNRILHGYETWSMVVTNWATGDGMSCERAAMIKAASRGGKKSRISCDVGGICIEQHPCQFKCADVSEVQSNVVTQFHLGNESCANSWSACDSSCVQTRVIAELLSDGLCHEKTRMTRPCHTGECANLHPCQVPYIVRAVIGFHGDGAKTWSHHLSESLATMLMAAIQNNTSDNHSVFTAGDVRLVSTSPWIPGNNKLHGEDFVIGTKAMIDISILNNNAFPADDSSEAFESHSNGLFAIAKGPRRSVRLKQTSQCDSSELYQLARYAVDLKETLLESPALLADLDQAFDLRSQIIAVTVLSSVKRDDEVAPMGNFMAGFHTHRLRMYVHHRPFTAFLCLLAAPFLVFGICFVFDLLQSILLKKIALIFHERALEDSSVEGDTSLSSEEDDEHLSAQLVPMTHDDELNLSFNRDCEDILERLLQRSSCTSPCRLKTESTSKDFPSFEYMHSMDESFDRSVSRGASPRKRRSERFDVESDLIMTCRKL